MVGVLGDRVAGGEKTVRCRFFGQETAFPVGPHAAGGAGMAVR